MTGPRPLTMVKTLIAEAEARFGARSFPDSWLSVGLIGVGSPRACMTKTANTAWFSSARI
jgi:hypothetical protein